MRILDAALPSLAKLTLDDVSADFCVFLAVDAIKALVDWLDVQQQQVPTLLHLSVNGDYESDQEEQERFFDFDEACGAIIKRLDTLCDERNFAFDLNVTADNGPDDSVS